jgi:hypothetical protein
MTNSKTFPNENKEETGFVVDHKELPSGQILYKVRILRKHGKNVLDEHLTWIPAEVSGTLFGSSSSGGALDKGQSVIVRQNVGEGGTSRHTVVSSNQNKEHGKTGIGGSQPLPGATDNVEKAKKEKRLKPIKQPPDLKEVMENGVKVIKTVEKGDWTFSKLDGLMNSMTVKPVFGLKVPQLTNVSTALDAFESKMTPDIMSQLPGLNISISNILNIMPAALKDELFKSLPDGLGQQFESVMSMARSYETTAAAGGMSAQKRVNPATFFTTAVNLLKGSQTIEEMIGKIYDLETDDTLSGLAELGSTVLKVPTAFGEITQTFDALGNLTTFKPDVMVKAEQAFAGIMGDVKVLESVKDKFLPMIDRIPNAQKQIFKNNFEELSAKVDVHGTKELAKFFT